MSQFNAIGESGFADLLTRRLTTPGGSSSPSVAPEIFPVLALEADRPEWGYLKGEVLAGVGATVAAGALRSMLWVQNPTGSGIIITIVGFALNAASGWSARIIPLDTAVTQVQAAFRDSRYLRGGTVTRPQATCWADNASGVNTSVPQALVSTSTDWQDVPFVLAPGAQFRIQAGADASALTNVSILWRERKAQPGELA